MAALLECQNTSLLGIPRMYSDERYRRWVLKQVKDPVVRQFWREFEDLDPRLIQEAIGPVLNKIVPVLAAPPLRNILGQVTSTFDVRFVMDNRRIFVANLAKGLIGDKANLLGSLLVTQFQLAAMSRASLPEAERRDCMLCVDEFSSFITDSFASMLSETRKYRLGLTLSTQFSTAIPPMVRDAAFGNCGTVASFRVGHADAELMSTHLGGPRAEELTALNNGEAVMRMIDRGKIAGPFMVRTLPPIEVPHGRRNRVVAQSRKRYTLPRKLVEDRIKRWMNST